MSDLFSLVGSAISNLTGGGATPPPVKSSPVKSSPVKPAMPNAPKVGPARLGGSVAGQLPAGLILPNNVVVTQGYHPGHTAYDLAGPAGIPIYAPEPMYINQAGYGNYGNDAIGTTPAGDKFIFGHFSAVAPGLKAGEFVPAGTLLGYEGSTFNAAAGGYSTGPHLHLEKRDKSGAPVMVSSADVLNTFLPAGIGGAGAAIKEALKTDSKPIPGPVADMPSPAQTTAQANQSLPRALSAPDLPAASTTAKESPNPNAIIYPAGTVGLYPGAPSWLNKNASNEQLKKAMNVKKSTADYVLIVAGTIMLILGLIFFMVASLKGESAITQTIREKVFTKKEKPEAK
jgi:murein DD-endopeptidase MepM/ murein hydrolase activator NlpD